MNNDGFVVGEEVLDLYAQRRPSVAESLQAQIDGIDESLRHVAETRHYLTELLEKCDAAREALIERRAEVRAALEQLAGSTTVLS